jgi:hypothetical protein
VSLGINEAAVAVETFLTSYEGRGGRTPREIRSHPSGDDMNAIKVWVNLGSAAESDDLEAWCKDAEAAIRKAVDVGTLTLEMRADAL